MRSTSEFLAIQPPSALVARYAATVHLIMAAGLAFSAISAVVVVSSPRLYTSLFTDEGLTLLGWVVTLSPLAIVLVLAGVVERLPLPAAWLLFLIFAILTGVSLASLFAAYTAASIVGAFTAAAGAYAVLAVVGYTIQRDLSGLGKFMLVALIGLILAMLANLFIRSSGADLVLAFAGILIFAGLVAVDSQRIRRIYEMNETGTPPGQLAVFGALTLYLDFLNLFLSLIRLTGRRRE